MNININAFDFEIIIRILLILISSFMIGYNRGKHHQFAGVKTHLFVGLGAGLSLLVPYIYYTNNPGVSGDPYRLAAQVISGIGFLGAGSIIKSGQTIKGLTTAATLWLTAIISISFASGAYLVSIFSASLVIIFLFFNKRLEITKKYSIKVLVFTLVDDGESVELLDQYIRTHATLNSHFQLLDNRFKDGEHIVRVKYELVHNQTDVSTYSLIRDICQFKFIRKVESITELEKL